MRDGALRYDCNWHYMSEIVFSSEPDFSNLKTYARGFRRDACCSGLLSLNYGVFSDCQVQVAVGTVYVNLVSKGNLTIY